MKSLSIARRVSMAAVLGLLPAAFASAEMKNQTATMKEGVQLIGQLEEVARDVRYNAERLVSFKTTMQISRWTHVHHLDQIKSLINEGLRPALDRLTEIQPELPSWKQQSIDTMLDAARTLAADTQAAFFAKKEAGALPPAMNPEYRELVTRVYEHADNLVKTTDAAGDYARARMKAAEAGIEVPKE